MTENSNDQIGFEQFKERLKEYLQKEKVEDEKEFVNFLKNYYGKLKKEQKEFLKYLELAFEKNGRKEEIRKIIEKITGENANDIMESLKNLGFHIQEKLGDDFAKAGLRLIEQTRAGKRSEVMYGITRIFMANRQNLPEILNEAFKPYYSEELFKCFMFTFLSSAIKSKEEEE